MPSASADADAAAPPMAARADPTPNGAYAARVDAALGFGLLYVLLAVAAQVEDVVETEGRKFATEAKRQTERVENDLNSKLKQEMAALLDKSWNQL